ncbi:MAG: hypothetical protein FD161_4811 [Limisphaerales bacterium]|nr:MAG: hypothetical protein FD161_4811 [Limisphaerales bacterium]
MGRPPVSCAACDKNRGHRPRARAEKALPADPTQGAKRRRARKAAQPVVAIATDAGAVRRLAIALRLDSEPERAAAWAGIRCTESQLAELVAEASKERYQPLREGATSATVTTLGVALALGAERLVAGMAEIPISFLPAALKAIAQAVDIMGGPKLTYSNISLSLGMPEEERKELDEFMRHRAEFNAFLEAKKTENSPPRLDS